MYWYYANELKKN